MVFSHIHYNTYFKFCTINLVFSSCFTHKNMHLQKCLTFGVHIKALSCFALNIKGCGNMPQPSLFYKLRKSVSRNKRKLIVFVCGFLCRICCWFCRNNRCFTLCNSYLNKCCIHYSEFAVVVHICM